jgi:thioredoxin-like negative regulator of GroEL
MKSVIIFNLLLLALATLQGKQISPTHPIATAQADALPLTPITREPLQLLYFTAAWCGPCQMMKSQTWPDSNVRQALGNYKFQTIDVDEFPDLAAHWSVRAMPTFIVADPGGTVELTRITGFMDAQRMHVWLTDVYEVAYNALEAQQAAKIAFSQQWAELDPLFKDSISTEDLQQANQALFKLLALRDALSPESAEDLENALVSLAETYPERIIDGFLHPDLQVRARIARVLRSDALNLNPWQPLEARQQAVELYQQTLRNTKEN